MMRDAGTTDSADCPFIANQEVRGSGRCGLHKQLRGRHERAVASNLAPSPPRSLQPRIRLRVKRSSPPAVHPTSHRPLVQRCFSPLSIFYALPQCPVGDLREWNQNIGWVVTPGRADQALRALLQRPWSPFVPTRDSLSPSPSPGAKSATRARPLAGRYCPGKMSFDFSAARAGALGEPGVQIGEGVPADSGVQISP